MSELSLRVVAGADTGVLCRITGFFAQLGLSPPGMTVKVESEAMKVELETDIPPSSIALLRGKIERVIGVGSVTEINC